MRRFLKYPLGLLLATSLANAGEMFLLLSDLPGESSDARHAGWIDVLSFSEGVRRPTGTARPIFTPLSLTKRLDRTSPQLAVFAASGKSIKSGTFEIVRDSEDRLRFLRVKLSGLKVTSFSQAGGATAGTPIEVVSLDFNTVEWTYTEIDGNGRPIQDITCSWNRLTGTGVGGADTDSDGLPDDYEILYNLNPNANDASADADGDGLNNLDEFRAGTVPNRADSVFQVHAIRNPSGQVTLSWTAFSDKTYRLLGAPSPNGPFTLVRNLDNAEQTAGELQLTPAGPNQFFILEVE